MIVCESFHHAIGLTYNNFRILRRPLDVGLPYKNMENVIAAEVAGIDAWIADLMIDSAVTMATKPEQSEYL